MKSNTYKNKFKIEKLKQNNIAQKIKAINQIEDKEERINQLIDIFMEQDNSFPMDTSSKLISYNFGKENHESLNFPGQYKMHLPTEMETQYTSNLKMDENTLVLLNGIISKLSVLNNEYQSQIPSTSKEDQAFNYRIGIVYRFGLPVITNFVGNFGDETRKEKIIKVGKHKFNALITNINDEEVEKRLNSLSNKINNNEEISIPEALNLSYAAIYSSKKIAKETLTQAIEKFTQAKIENQKLKSIIFQSLKNMVKHRFEDETEIRRLLKMMLEEMIKENMEIMAKYYSEEEFIKREESLLKKNTNLEGENINLKGENTKLKQEIKELKAKLQSNQLYSK